MGEQTASDRSYCPITGIACDCEHNGDGVCKSDHPDDPQRQRRDRSDFPRYWTWDEIQRFLLDNDLAIAEGIDPDDDMALTARGEELFDVLAMAKHLGGGVPR